MSLRLQAALLRALENREIRPAGSTRVHPFSARIVAATSEPLEERVARREFRSDLYYRLKALHIALTPLRERAEDIPLLAKHFLSEFVGDADVGLGEDLLEALKRRVWPGNIRELRNDIQRLLILSGERRVLGADLPLATEDSLSETPSQPAQTPAYGRGQIIQQRRKSLKRLFETQHRLTGKEVVQLLGCARLTAESDLRALEAEGAIRRVRVSGTGRTSCLVWIGSSARGRS